MSHSHQPSADLARHPAPGRTAAAVSRHLHRVQGGYTLTHGGRQVRIGPVAFWIVVGTLVIMGVWSIATGTYFAFRENVLTRLIGHQAAMQIAYEDRIAELRAQVDRITSRQLLDQEQFERKLDVLLKRQATLERRTSTFADEFGVTGSIQPDRDAAPANFDADRLLKLKPINDTVIFKAPPDREAQLQSRAPPASETHIAALANAAGLDGVLARVSYSLDMVERRQTALLTDLEQHFGSTARRMRSVLDDLGIDPKASAHARMGGPFVPVKPPGAGASAFERQMYRIDFDRAQIDHLSHVLNAVPVRKPVAGLLDMTSPFGVRLDPFLGRPAMHTGVDLRGDIGEPVRATAAGRVTMAGRDGGYGKMVELNHGDGLSTRYGHLSEIDVKVGQSVRTGEVIGRIGSTGRSTGPHLHYETRINGEPVDPQKFLRAGIRLGSL
jgi:murein DD-endopeptidase MepM/ murein hydrolase activator NlpD